MMNPPKELVNSHSWVYIPWPESFECQKCKAELIYHNANDFSIVPEIKAGKKCGEA